MNNYSEDLICRAHRASKIVPEILCRIEFGDVGPYGLKFVHCLLATSILSIG